MLFINNKYTKWYYQIIESAKNSNHSCYTEKHHIIPKSLGGTNNLSNIVSLTARQHFICHWLLTKMTDGIFTTKKEIQKVLLIPEWTLNIIYKNLDALPINNERRSKKIKHLNIDYTKTWRKNGFDIIN